MPGPKCSVCQHALVADINAAIATGASTRSIAKQFGVSDSAVFRHAQHLPREVTKTAAVRKAAQDLDLFLLLEQNLDLAAKGVTLAFGKNQLQAAAAFLGRRTELIALLAKLKTDAALISQAQQPLSNLELLQARSVADRLSPSARVELAQAIVAEHVRPAG